MVLDICYFQPYLGRWSNLSNILQTGWNHQPEYINTFALTFIVFGMFVLGESNLVESKIGKVSFRANHAMAHWG